MEINDSINKYKALSKTINSLLNLILYFTRVFFKVFPSQGENIAVISFHKLGDSIFTIPAIREIQKNYKKRIIILCYPEVVPIYKLAVSDVEFYKIEHKYFFFNERIAGFKARKILKSSNPEIIFDFNGVMTSVSLIISSKATKIIGMGREQYRKLYDYYTPIRRVPHMIDRYLDIVATVVPQLNDTFYRSEIKIFPVENHSKLKILIHPFAGWKAKEWNLNKFISLAVKLSDQFQIGIVSQQNEISNDIIDELSEHNIGFYETPTVHDLIEKIKQCSLFIGNDSGPRHIASILGKPTFTIYGPTNPDFSVSFGKHHNFISKKLKCSPEKNKDYCFTLAGQSGCPSYECMNQLEVLEVYESIINFLQQKK